jgi:hypothetical protein
MKGVRLFVEGNHIGTLYNGELRLETLLGRAAYSWQPDKPKKELTDNFKKKKRG